MIKSMQTWSAVVQTRCQNGEEMWFKWLWPWNECWCQTGWFEYLRKLLILDFHAQQFLEFAENRAKNKKHPESSSYVGRNPLLMRDVRGEGPDWSKQEGDSNANNYNSGMQKSISEHTMRQTSTCIGYSSRRPISLKNKPIKYPIKRLLSVYWCAAQIS